MRAIELYDNITVSIDARKTGDGFLAAEDLGGRGIFLTAIGSAVLGVWGLVCLVAGLSTCGNFALLKETVLMALTGM